MGKHPSGTGHDLPRRGAADADQPTLVHGFLLRGNSMNAAAKSELYCLSVVFGEGLGVVYVLGTIVLDILRW